MFPKALKGLANFSPIFILSKILVVFFFKSSVVILPGSFNSFSVVY